MSKITTHVLDVVMGKPAADVAVALELKKHGIWTPLAAGATDADGRCRDLCDDAAAGEYRLTFGVAAYFARMNRSGIYAEITITFHCSGEAHYHLPLLLSDNSYTTYRGS
jgi:5-hydroxyisourate hydrolase